MSKDNLNDENYGVRDKRGNWKPFGTIAINPPTSIFFNPVKLIKYFFKYPGIFFPWTFVFGAITVATYFFLTPSLETMKTLEVGWIAFIFFRNAGIILIWTGMFHLRFKTQGTSFKYNPRPLEENNPTFLFHNQTKDNLFYTFCSAIPLWTAYEVITFWAFANQLIPYVSWEVYPVYCCLMFFLVPFIRDAHFYLTHRLLHWGPLYRIAHKVHHRNTNTGAWSGMSMHPIEHILYFSGILIHWIIPSHPLVAMYHVFHAGLAPTPGHTGYEKMTFKNGVTIPTGDYMHYIHHKYFECNYSGGNTSFLDKLMGTFHDGSEDATKEVMARIKDKAHYL